MKQRVIIIGFLFIATMQLGLGAVSVTPDAIDFSDESTISFKLTDIDRDEEIVLHDDDRALNPTAGEINLTDNGRSISITDNGRMITIGSGTDHDTFYINITTDPAATSTRSFDIEADGQTETVEVYIDNQAPTITGLEPANDTVNQTHFDTDIEATVTDEGELNASSIELTVNGETIAHDWDGSDNELQATDIELERGTNTLEITAQDSFGHEQVTEWTVHVAEKPIITSKSPTGLIKNDQPTIELAVADPADIDWDSTSISINGKDVDHTFDRFDYEQDGDGYTITYDTAEQQDDGEQTIEATITSTGSQERAHTWTYEVDATDPTIEATALRDGERHQGTIPVWVDTQDDGSGIAEVTASIDGQDYDLLHSKDDRYIEQIDSTEIEDGEQTITYQVEDEAGNTVTDTDTITIDNTPPTLEDITVFPDPTTTAPNLTVEAEDTATDVTAVEYFIDNDPGEGEATKLSHNGESFDTYEYRGTIPIEDLDDGTVPISIRARDQAQHWSDIETYRLELNRSLTTALSLSVPAGINLTQGDVTTIDVEVSNDGDIAERVRLRKGNDFVTGVTPDDQIIQPGTSRIFETTIAAPANASLGDQRIDITARSQASASSKGLRITVRPDAETREQLEARLDELKDELEGIRAEKNEWTPYLDEEHKKQTQQRLEETQKEIGRIEQALDDGEYLTLHRNQEDVETLVSQADQTIDEGVERYQESHRARQLILIVLIIVGLGAVGIRYQYGSRNDEDEGQPTYQGQKDPKSVSENLQERSNDLIAAMREQITQLSDQMSNTDDDDESWTGYEPN